MLSEMMGFVAVYGLFGITPGMMEYCGTHRTFASRNSGTQLSNPETELLEEGAPKSSLPEVNHQNKLWLFWAHYLRDSIAKLYFGFHFGMDAKPMTAELPKIKDFVGLGGRVPPSVESTAATTAMKRTREVFSGPCKSGPDKRFFPDPEEHEDGDLDGPTQYRSTQVPCADSDDSGDDESSVSQRAGSEGDHDVVRASRPSYGVERPSEAGGENSFGRKVSTLSKEVLEAQSRGNSILHGMSETAENLDPQAMETHMERMEILLRSQEDPTDGGSYARVLFLEEVRLWIIGRRLSAYLASRTTGETPYHPIGLSNLTTSESTDPSPSSIREAPGFWSEEAWKEDQELQSLQADLIEWENDLPDHLKFRMDIDHPDVNHKVNGKMCKCGSIFGTLPFLRVSEKTCVKISDHSMSHSTNSRNHDGLLHHHHPPSDVLSSRASRPITAKAPVKETQFSALSLRRVQQGRRFSTRYQYKPEAGL